MRTLIAGDFHCKFHDVLLFKLFIGFILQEKPERIVLNGDFMDFYRISSFDQDPLRAESLQNEINEGFNLLHDIREAAGDSCEIIYNKGNHEDRLRRWIWKNPQIHGLDCLKFERLMDLDKLNIIYKEDGIWIGKFFVYHGTIVRKHAGYTARAEFEKNGCSGVSNHTHRDGKYGVRNRHGNYVWHEGFCMCDLDAEYINGIANWTQGWSMMYDVNGRQYIDQIPVINHRYIWKGKEIK